MIRPIWECPIMGAGWAAVQRELENWKSANPLIHLFGVTIEISTLKGGFWEKNMLVQNKLGGYKVKKEVAPHYTLDNVSVGNKELL